MGQSTSRTKEHLPEEFLLQESPPTHQQHEHSTRSVHPDFLELCEATLRNDEDGVRRLLATDVDIRHKENDAAMMLPRGGTLLHLAAKKRRPDALRPLLQHRHAAALVNETDDRGRTPIMYAVARGGLEPVLQLLAKGADCGAADATRRTALHIAAELGLHAVLPYLLRQISAKHSPDSRGWTPLMAAAHAGHARCVRQLLDADANHLMHRDTQGRSLLHLAARNDSSEVLILLARNSHVETLIHESPISAPDGDIVPSYRGLLNSPDEAGLTPLMTAVKFESISCTIELLNMNARRDIPGQNGNTIFHIAAQVGNSTILKLLLMSDQCRKLITKSVVGNTNITANSVSQEIMAAAIEEEIWLQDLIFLYGIKQGIRKIKEIMGSTYYETRFDNTCSKTNEVLKVNLNNQNCFHLAASRGNALCLNVLYASLAQCDWEGRVEFPQGALDRPDAQGHTPLHLAARARSTDSIVFLLQHGANLLARSTLLTAADTHDLFKPETKAREPSPNQEKTSTFTKNISKFIDESVRVSLLVEAPEKVYMSYIRRHPSYTTPLNLILDIPHGENIIKEVLDSCVSNETDSEGTKICQLDFKVLDPEGESKIAVVYELTKHRNKHMHEVLQHPVLNTFVERNWVMWRYIFWYRFAIYALYMLFLTLYLCMPIASTAAQVFRFPLGILAVLVAFFCLPYVLPGPIPITQRAVVIVMTIVPPILTLVSVVVDFAQTWFVPVFSIAVLFSWLSLILYSSILPLLSQQAAMFQTVLVKMVSYSLVFVVVMLGFTFTFLILYSKDENFRSFWRAMLYTVVILLQGAMEHAPLFKEDQRGASFFLQVAGGVATLLFVAVSVMALLNMLVGLAVRGAEDLKTQGRIYLLRSQVQLLVEMDVMLKFRRASPLLTLLRNPSNWAEVDSPQTIENKVTLLKYKYNNLPDQLATKLSDIAERNVKGQ